MYTQNIIPHMKTTGHVTDRGTTNLLSTKVSVYGVFVADVYKGPLRTRCITRRVEL